MTVLGTQSYIYRTGTCAGEIAGVGAWTAVFSSVWMPKLLCNQAAVARVVDVAIEVAPQGFENAMAER